MDIDVISAVMRLFKGWDITVDQNQDEYDRQQVEQLLYESLIAADLRDYAISETTTNAAISIWGINIENLTGTFHKSFSTVENTDYMTLIYQQLLHYFTTYGAELFGSYDREAVFIPTEVSEIPEIIQGMKLTVIRPFDPAEIRERITTLAHQNMGLSDKVLYDLAILYKHYLPNTTEVEISNLPNRELKIRLYDTLELIPYEADEFLRYCIFLATGKTLLIKNRNVIELLKAWANSATGAAYILRATKELDRRILAQSYHRYHEYWLSMKQIKAATDEDKAINAFINKVSKLADKHHRPLSHNVLQNVCDATITLEDIERAVQEASDAQLMKTWEYLLFIRSFTYSIATTSEIDLPRNYMIRNGSVWTKVTSMQSIETLQQRIEPIQAELQKRFAHLAGKSFYIPSNVAYPLYTSGKKTVGVLPHGTVLSIHFNESEPESSDNNIIVAIHWFDAGDTGDASERVDLDLHAVTSSGAIGWYTGYRTEHCEIVYSGDVTAAPKPNGATEAMLVKGDITDLELTFSMNNFTRNNEVIPFDVIIAKGSAEDISNNYVIDPNKIIVNFCTEVAPGKAQQELGTLIKNEEALNFIVGGFATGNSRVSFTSEIQNQRRQANKLEFLHRPGFTDFLEDIVCTYRIALTHEEADFDLSLESLQADTFSQILSKPQR